MARDEIQELIEPFAAEAEEAFAAFETALLQIESAAGGASASLAGLRDHLRALHTVKGNAGMLGMPQLAGAVHQLEEIIKRGLRVEADALGGLLNLMDEFRAGLAAVRGGAEDAEGLDVWTQWLRGLLDAGAEVAGDAAAFADAATDAAVDEGERGERARSLRVDAETLDQLQREVGELILASNALRQTFRAHAAERLSRGERRLLVDAFDRLERSVRSVQDRTTQTRLLGLSTILRRVPRIARDAAARSGRQVQVAVSGEAVQADKGVVESLADVLVHLVRNAVDHGIETADLREALGKPAAGQVRVEVLGRGEFVVIIVEDDGGGIDADMVRSKAVERGFFSAEAAAEADDDTVLRWLFRAGFSTRDATTELSGRGVGLDVVEQTVRELGGSVRLQSTRGQGTRFELMVPVSTAVADLMEVEVAGRPLFVPLRRIVATGRFDPEALENPAGLPHYRFRDELVPMVPLARRFASDAGEGGYMMVLERSAGPVCVRIAAILGKGQAVLHPLADPLLRRGPFSAATVRGDGHVGLILDPDRLAADSSEATA